MASSKRAIGILLGVGIVGMIALAAFDFRHQGERSALQENSASALSGPKRQSEDLSVGIRDRMGRLDRKGVRAHGDEPKAQAQTSYSQSDLPRRIAGTNAQEEEKLLSHTLTVQVLKASGAPYEKWCTVQLQGDTWSGGAVVCEKGVGTLKVSQIGESLTIIATPEPPYLPVRETWQPDGQDASLQLTLDGTYPTLRGRIVNGQGDPQHTTLTLHFQPSGMASAWSDPGGYFELHLTPTGSSQARLEIPPSSHSGSTKSQQVYFAPLHSGANVDLGELVFQ